MTKIRIMQLLPFVATLALSAFLLFLIQPLFAKLLLPFFGGVPAVWNICMMFFQGILLIGYIYAYLLSRLSFRTERYLHCIIVIISLLFLPLLLGKIYQPFLQFPIATLLSLLIVKLGFPLFVLSTTAPLLQSWFSRTNYGGAEDPYFLYSASNIGSFAALLGFSFLLEPLIGLQKLLFAWAIIYCLFAILLFLCAIWSRPVTQAFEKIKSDKKIFFKRRLYWLILAFAPTSLLLGVTTYITTDITPTPLLWIIPFAIYLLCFVIAFGSRSYVTSALIRNTQVYFLFFPLLALSHVFSLTGWEIIVFHLIGFSSLTLSCLFTLVEDRPHKNYLTEFYIWIALGGFLAGIFNSIIAPMIFRDVYEYYLAFCLCILLSVPLISAKKIPIRHYALYGLLIVGLLVVDYFLPHFLTFITPHQASGILTVVIIAIILIFDHHPIRLTLGVALLCIFFEISGQPSNAKIIFQDRNFFGVTKILQYQEPRTHTLVSGNTLHGIQVISLPMSLNRSTSYYGPVENVINLLRSKRNSLIVGVAGLGTGTLSCLFNENDTVTFFEINPTMVHIAHNPRLFSYLTLCPPKGGIKMGDARLKLAEQPAQKYDALILDTFSSDAIPIHILTLEAVQMYFSKIKADGLLLFNVSNRYLDLLPVLNSIGDRLGVYTLYQAFDSNPEKFQAASIWVILTSDKELAAQLVQSFHYQLLTKNVPPILWTDDYSNILRTLRSRALFF